MGVVLRLQCLDGNKKTGFKPYVNTQDAPGTFYPDTLLGRDRGSFADVNEDGLADYVVVAGDSNNARHLAVYLSKGDGTFIVPYINTVDEPGTFYPDTSGRDRGSFADVNGDGLADYVVVAGDSNNARHLSNWTKLE